MNPRLKSGLVLAGVFLLGGVTGGSISRLVSARHQHHMLDTPPDVARRDFIVRTLDREVDMDPEQRTKVGEILASHDAEVRALHAEMAPKARPLRAKVMAEIRAVMRPDQMAPFDKVAEKFEKHARESEE